MKSILLAAIILLCAGLSSAIDDSALISAGNDLTKAYDNATIKIIVETEDGNYTGYVSKNGSTVIGSDYQSEDELLFLMSKVTSNEPWCPALEPYTPFWRWL